MTILEWIIIIIGLLLETGLLMIYTRLGDLIMLILLKGDLTKLYENNTKDLF